MSKNNSVFPKIKSEKIVMLIFSYVDLYDRAMIKLKQLNSRGYDIVQRQYMYR